jgi:outer membrane protein assembly factor BamB
MKGAIQSTHLKKCVFAILASGFFTHLLSQQVEASKNWGQWRGPLATGYAPNADPPIEWSETKNILWKTALPGLGHSSPIVWGDHLYLTTAIPNGDKLPVPEQPSGAHNNLDPFHKLEFTVLAINRKSGKITWQKIAHTTQPHQSTHESGTWASNSPVTDGEHVIASFGSAGVFCLKAANGELVWKKDLGDMEVKHGHGEGSSPALHNNSLAINWDHEGESFVTVLDKRTGREIWRKERNEPTNWSTPIIVQHNKQTLLIISATNAVRAYDLTTGKVLWHTTGLPHNVVASPVHHNGIVYAGASYEKRTMLAIKLDGAKGDISRTDNILWTRRAATPYVPSPLLMPDQTLYFFHHYQGFLSKMEGLTGKDLGPFRLGQMGNFYASPVAAKDRVYLTDRKGQTLVIQHNRKPKMISLNKLEDSFSSSPAISGRTLFLRGEKFLYCLGSATAGGG